MRKILRLVYVSRANFGPSPEEADASINDILCQARKNNRRTKISGALFYSDGYFFQCLEGKEKLVYKLLETLKNDCRHTDLKVSYCKRVRGRRFASWTMKYVPVTDTIKELMLAKGYSNFFPTEFDESDINVVIDAFSRIEDTSLKDRSLRSNSRPKGHWLKRFYSSFSQLMV